MTLTTSPTPDLRPLGRDGVLALVETLPPWRRHLDDDPVWVRHVSCVGLDVDTRPVDLDNEALHAIAAGQRPSVHVPTELVTTASQPHVRLDAVAFYLRQQGALFDPDPWYGQDLPLLMPLPTGQYRVLDGTNRAAAAKVTGAPTLEAYVLLAHECPLQG